MFEFIRRKARRKALEAFLRQTFRWNEADQCWDPVGSISRLGMMTVMDQVVHEGAVPRLQPQKAGRGILVRAKGG